MNKMTMFFLKGLSLSVVLLAAGYGQMVSAHTQNGSLGAPAETTDVWLATCTTGDSANARLEVSVKNVTPSSPLLSIHVSKNGTTLSATDAVSGDSNFSPKISLTKGDGGYTLTLDKAGSGVVNYSIELHCKTGSGLHTGDDTSIVILEDDTTDGGGGGATGEVFKLNTSGNQYCPGAAPVKLNPSNDVDLWLHLDSDTQMTAYRDAELTVPLVTFDVIMDSYASNAASFDAFYYGDADNHFEAIGVLKFKKDGSAKSLKATFLRTGILDSCYSKGTLTGKRVN